MVLKRSVISQSTLISATVQKDSNHKKKIQRCMCDYVHIHVCTYTLRNETHTVDITESTVKLMSVRHFPKGLRYIEVPI